MPPHGIQPRLRCTERRAHCRPSSARFVIQACWGVLYRSSLADQMSCAFLSASLDSLDFYVSVEVGERSCLLGILWESGLSTVDDL
jgi:hypothetical protein